MAHDPRVVRTDAQGRALVVAAVLIVAGSLCFGRLAQWQLVDRERLLEAAGSRISDTAVADPLRGSITDRSGSVVLASTVMRQQLVAQPSALSAEEKVSVRDALITLLELDGRPPHALPRGSTPRVSGASFTLGLPTKRLAS